MILIFSRGLHNDKMRYCRHLEDKLPSVKAPDLSKYILNWVLTANRCYTSRGDFSRWSIGNGLQISVQFFWNVGNEQTTLLLSSCADRDAVDRAPTRPPLKPIWLITSAVRSRQLGGRVILPMGVRRCSRQPMNNRAVKSDLARSQDADWAIFHDLKNLAS